MNLLAELFASLNEAGVEYLVAGGVAVNLYGIQRSTGDVDIVLGLDEGNVRKFLAVAGRLGLKPTAPVGVEEFADREKRAMWVLEKGMKVFSLSHGRKPFFQVDVLVEEPFPFVEVYSRRKKFEAEGVEIPVVPIADLISMKEATGRPQDEADVFYLKEISREWEDEG